MRKKPPLFTAAQFTPTHWDTADDKAKFANQFAKFVENDFRPHDFPRWFYTRLSNAFGHIAHYNHNGFYAEFFHDPDSKVAFLCHTLEAGGYGDPAYTYSDVEKVLKVWVMERGLLDTYRQLAAKSQEMAERKQLAVLKAKYE